MIKGSLINQAEILSILGGIFFIKGHTTEGWILISLGIIGSFIKYGVNIQTENQKTERRLLSESTKGLDELTKKLTEISSK